MKKLIALLALAPAPALAAGDKPFFSLANTDFVVLIAFLLFIGVLVYFKVPGLLMGLLDKRAETIKSELDEAKALREEAQTILASYERKQKEVAEQSERIIANAKKEAQAAAEQAKEDLKLSIERRLAGAEEQIASAEAAAVKQVRDRAVSVAIAAAADVVAAKTSAADQNKLVDAAIDEVKAKLH
ncbi:F0F1 ATP synthase subunit B [uncultured Litoreibacter sp.]|uniref:F0F1 ATP synthase subunit B n=1 Tax=uncultured Litoreibacter sp. TaxID=1392394 RepID=UPI002609B0F3|nr:F0F1 ATP synthase subunit B [uncultured Litoreibacter sp.]